MQKAIEIYKNFKCLEGTCPDTCCRGWQVLIDDTSFENICKDGTPLGKRMKRLVKRFPERVLKKNFIGRCPFETKEGLCSLHRDGRFDIMPLICQEYPRRMLGINGDVELTLELACPVVAKMFLEDRNLGRRLEYYEINENHPSMWTLNNDEPEHLEYMYGFRDKILDFVWGSSMGLGEVCNTLYSYCNRIQQEILRGKWQEAAAEEVLADKAENAGFAFFTMQLIDKFITYNLYDPALSYANRRLYKRIKQYHKLFDNLRVGEIDDFFERNMRRMISLNPKLQEKYRSYLSYVLQQNFIVCYEDYDLISATVLPIVYTQILMVMDLTIFLSHEDMGDENMALELASLEKRMRHNTSISEGIMNRIRGEANE